MKKALPASIGVMIIVALALPCRPASGAEVGGAASGLEAPAKVARKPVTLPEGTPSATLNQVCFLDDKAGWIVGQNGLVLKAQAADLK